MFCPQCGLTQPDDLNFCKSCGSNLNAVRTALVAGAGDSKFDWNKTWLAEMLLSSEEKVKRAAEIESRRSKIPEVKRRNEIKAGVITTSVGVGTTLVISMIMEGIIASGLVDGGVVAILSRVWVAGLIPIFVGLALIFNGVFVSKKGLPPGMAADEDEAAQLPAADTNELPPAAPFSVTDETTRHLDETAKRKKTAHL